MRSEDQRCRVTAVGLRAVENAFKVGQILLNKSDV